ncbi:hypothetical protein PINS_up023318 [Pythium insidiosum]|nr:hypothetical protein PINS_up023318 [Pythium insidiosum]
MVLYVIGLGLGDENDITLRGLNAVKKCQKVFLENYTSILGIDHAKLSEFYGREVVLADRDCVETGADQILDGAKDGDVAFLVVGDPLCATTHTDLIIRARELEIPVEVVHNASVMGAAASVRPAALLVWPDRVDPVLHGGVAPRQLLRQDHVQPQGRHAHAVPARHQGQGARL